MGYDHKQFRILTRLPYPDHKLMSLKVSHVTEPKQDT